MAAASMKHTLCSLPKTPCVFRATAFCPQQRLPGSTLRHLRKYQPAAYAADLPDFGDGPSTSGEARSRTGRQQRTSFQTAIARVRAIAFFTWSMAVAIPLFLVMLAVFPFVLMFDRSRRRAEHQVNKLWAKLSTWPFLPVKIEGVENMPDDSVPAVYVANHESYMDIFSLFHLGKDFKFVSKGSIFLIPIVGWSMFLTGHVLLNRLDAAGFKRFISLGKDLLSAGASLFVFPEGTRSVDGKLMEFKKGAFTIASTAKAVVVPITILGSGDVMPSGHEGELYSDQITIIVHPPLDSRGMKTAELCDKCREIIASRLPAWKLA